MLADLPVASWVLDRRTRRFLDVNDAAVELYGFSRDDFARMTLADIWPTDEVDGLLGMLDRAGSTVRSSGPWQHRHQDGHPLDVLISARRVDRDGRSTVVIVAEDATTQRREEARLRASEERLRLALAAGQMGTWEWRPFDDWIVWEGPPGGPSGADTWRGKLVDFLHLVHPDDQERVTRALNQSVVERTDLAVEFRVVAPGGATRWIMAFGRVIPDEQGAPALMIGLAVDLTDRKGLEDRVVRSERLGMLGQLAAGISHDLNQSLALIGGYGDLAEQALTLPAPDLASLVDYVGIICKAASDASEAVHRLLTFARGHEPVQPQPVDVANLLRDVARLTAPRWRDLPEAEGRPVSLEIEIVDPTPALTVVGWPASLREALTNLIFNAVDALPNGGTIRLTGRRQHDAVVVEVADNGIGMPLEVRPRIFEPFFTTKGDRGTGLGLAQVLSIARRHGGRVEIDAAQPWSTICRLIFPSGNQPEISVSRSSPDVASPSRRLRVLPSEGLVPPPPSPQPESDDVVSLKRFVLVGRPDRAGGWANVPENWNPPRSPRVR